MIWHNKIISRKFPIWLVVNSETNIKIIRDNVNDNKRRREIKITTDL